MGKHEPMSAKAIAIRIKAKGLQKIKYYCEMCKKQCRDDNGFKCHIMSESHQRKALVVAENPDKFVGEFSQQFLDGFMYLVKARYKFKKVLANTIFQEYIKERDHVHLNATRWTTLTEFAYWLHEKELVKAEESERGVMITYIDRDPETLRRKDLLLKRAERAKELEEQNLIELEKQKEATRSVLESKSEAPPSTSEVEIIERPMLKIQTISIKNPVTSNYKPPPPKRKRVKV